MRRQGGSGVQDIVARLGAPARRQRGTPVRMAGPAEWAVSLDAGGNASEIVVAGEGGEDPAWRWDLRLDGVHLRGGRGRRIEAVRAVAAIVILEVL